MMLFLRYISDVWKDKRTQYEERYQGDAGRVERALGREKANVGEPVNIALEQIEDANKAKLENVFRNIDFNSEPHLGRTKDRNRLLKQLPEDFADPRLDLRPSRTGDKDVIGDAYEYLIARFASDAGKKAGEFYTPSEVASPAGPAPPPAAGGDHLRPVVRVRGAAHQGGPRGGGPDFSLFGQEPNGSTWALCRMNMFVHEFDGVRVEWCNTITSPKLVGGDRLMRSDVVAANPPFSPDRCERGSNERPPRPARHRPGLRHPVRPARHTRPPTGRPGDRGAGRHLSAGTR